jgi:hypothetical protein
VAGSSAWCFTLGNGASGGAPTEAVTAFPNSPPANWSSAQVAEVHKGFDIDFTDSSFSSGLGDIDVEFVPTPCANLARVSFGPAIAKAADANCTPPSHTKITQAKINKNKHTAFFKFKAKGTKKFKCTLTRNGKRLLLQLLQVAEALRQQAEEGPVRLLRRRDQPGRRRPQASQEKVRAAVASRGRIHSGRIRPRAINRAGLDLW